MKNSSSAATVCLLAGTLLAHLGAAPTARAAEPEWKAAVARVKITPEQPVFLEGYASRNRPFDKVAADLYAKALVLEDNHGQRIVLVTSDLIGFPAAVAEPICERLHDKAGLRREQIILSASHTHTGPRLSLNSRSLENMPPGDAQRTVAYTQQLQDKVVELVMRAMMRVSPCRLSWGTGVCHFVMNRRETTPHGVILGVNPRGLADRSVPVLRVEDPDGKLQAILFGYACHNTTLTDRDYDLCGDYAGFAQAYIEEQNPSAQALFLTGFAGDANPYPRGSLALARQHGAELGKEVCRLLQTKLQPVHGPLHLAFARADLPLQPAPPRDELQRRAGRSGVDAWVAKKMLATLDENGKLPSHYKAPFVLCQLGPDLTLVGLPGEVVAGYVPLLERALGPTHLWLAGYCNDVFGYLPTARVLREGGYETRGLYSGGVGLFAPNAQDVVVDTVRLLAEKAGRQLPARQPR